MSCFNRFNPVPCLNSRKKIDVNTQIQEDSKLKWRLGQSAFTYTKNVVVTCTFCRNAYQSFGMKVVHNVNGYNYLIDRHLMGDINIVSHMIVCGECRNQIPRGWFGCNCKEKEK